jgi:hypothetical protein
MAIRSRPDFSNRGGLCSTSRAPTLLLRFVGSFLLRFAERVFLELLFQLPPRRIRLAAPVPRWGCAERSTPSPDLLSDFLDAFCRECVLL